ncbi:hypothetical protein SDC9_132629 [bioreactor metagenome]|uniref:Uncharacterized protein n=1 Tax=bioreactor metagenome TaxID=1076179 RepID=A0A645D921_9ZZZZ
MTLRISFFHSIRHFKIVYHDRFSLPYHLAPDARFFQLVFRLSFDHRTFSHHILRPGIQNKFFHFLVVQINVSEPAFGQLQRFVQNIVELFLGGFKIYLEHVQQNLVSLLGFFLFLSMLIFLSYILDVGSYPKFSVWHSDRELRCLILSVFPFHLIDDNRLLFNNGKVCFSAFLCKFPYCQIKIFTTDDFSGILMKEFLKGPVDKYVFQILIL